MQVCKKGRRYIGLVINMLPSSGNTKSFANKIYNDLLRRTTAFTHCLWWFTMIHSNLLRRGTAFTIIYNHLQWIFTIIYCGGGQHSHIVWAGHWAAFFTENFNFCSSDCDVFSLLIKLRFPLSIKVFAQSHNINSSNIQQWTDHSWETWHWEPFHFKEKIRTFGWRSCLTINQRRS